MERIDVDTLCRDAKGNYYNIHMTKHTQGPLLEVLDSIRNFIFDTAISGTDIIWTGWEEVMPGDFVYWIHPGSHLYVFLDAEAAQHTYNSLCFTRNGNQITITNFGPFGWNKGCTQKFSKKGGELVARDQLHDEAVVAATIAAKEGLKYLTKDEPVLRFASGMIFSALRASDGDLAGAGLEASAAAAPLVLGKGTAASHVTNMFETALLMKDLYDAMK
ncbi:uncharacterized protein LOC121421776 [Lytechinus variegatus]|uniref:uncharacterized protein LOC121421776 n=1 Tax=Lytechinus variegatus TaxID=7654 RepID=UPI001BB24231|nr:uncharacterized protein LOC121421776 [Lytechinus variegatus]XP_041472510.1 uncharacterized protein LOC121421776 [Lytechinus variegatus]